MTDGHVGLDVVADREDEAFIKDFVSRGAGGDGGDTSDDTPSGVPKKAEPKKEPKREPKKEAPVVDETPTEDDTEHPDDAPDSDEDSTDPDDDAIEDDDEDDTDAAEHPDTDSAPRVAAEKKAFTDALETQGVSFAKVLEDVPEEYRPIFEKKAKELQAGFTKARQMDREQFKDVVSLRAEMQLMKDRPADLIVEQILRNPALAEQINGKLDQLDKMDQLDGKAGSAAQAHQESVKRAREGAVTSAQAAAAKADTDARRIDAITQEGMRAARAAGVPFQAGVEDAIAAQLALGNLAITKEQIAQIAGEKAAVWDRSTRAVRREATKEYARAKAKDRRTAGLKVKPNAGNSAGPPAKTGPTTDDEFVAHMRDKYH
jgi:hypothetical protein